MIVKIESPAMLYAVTEAVEGGWELSVYRSTKVSVDGRLYRPVRDLLDTHCVTELESELVEDAGMMWCEAERTEYLVWASCPSVSHRCIRVPQQRTEENDRESRERAIA